MEIQLSDAEKVFIIRGAEDGFRNDGRGFVCEDYRPFIVERGVLSTTDGSARVRLDATDLLVGVKCEMQSVEDTTLETNRIRFSVDCSANASPQFEGKGGDLFAEDIVSALEASYCNDFVLPDMHKLIVSPNHMWVLYVDVVILQYGGSIVDAASLGVKAALSDTSLCVLNTRPADAKKMTIELPDSGDTWSLDLTRSPLIVSISKIGTANVIDCTITEEVCVRSSLWVAVCPAPKENSPDDACVLTLVRQAAGGSLEKQSVEEMIDTGIRAARRLHSALSSRMNEEDASDLPPPGSTFLA